MRASARIEQTPGNWRGFGRVRLYPLPACIGSRRPRARDISGDQEPPAITYSSAENSPPKFVLDMQHEIVRPTDPASCRNRPTPPPHTTSTPSSPHCDGGPAIKRFGERWQSFGK